jgi:glycerophosphoryl diester phosphodiesterase
MRKLAWLAAGFAVIIAVVYFTILLLARPVPEHAFFGPDTPLVIAHRGGRGLWPENTLFAFRESAALGSDVLEMDIHSTQDDVLVVCHDETLDRTTNGQGPIHDLTLSEVQALDAGYQWTADEGASYPFRGKGIRVPTLEEVFQTFPEMRLNIEIKQSNPPLSAPLCQMIRDYEMEERVLVASFDPSTMKGFRTQCPEVATSATAPEIRWFLRMHKFALGRIYRGPAEAFEVPVRLGDRDIVTPRFIEDSERHNIRALVWTVNDVDQMERLLDLGADGILTDYPDRLLMLLGR